jgi:hypothetical protein
MSLDSPLLTSRTATIDFLLAIVTLEYPKGHQLVMAAMEHFKLQRSATRIFDVLVESLYSFVNSRGVFGSKVRAGSDHHSTMFSFLAEKSNQPTEREIREYLVIDS